MKNSLFISTLAFLAISCNEEPSEVETAPVEEERIVADPPIQEEEMESVLDVETEPKEPLDTTSLAYLEFLLDTKRPLNPFWTDKLGAIERENDQEWLDFQNPYFTLSIQRVWQINDSVDAAILRYTTGVSFDEFLLTFRNGSEFIAQLHITDGADRDLSADGEFIYMEHQFLNSTKVRRDITIYIGPEETEEVKESTDVWLIEENGKMSAEVSGDGRK
ncbi:MAG: hypothetical protein HWD92_04685 [Flavobacteriia bacterium]|nr:hypothetical protein [Flavobacteriia bacterium]